MKKVKDSISIYYKRIETLINQNDPDYNSLVQIFGYKSMIVRDDEHKYMFEIYCPILIEKGSIKLKAKERIIQMPKSFKDLLRIE